MYQSIAHTLTEMNTSLVRKIVSHITRTMYQHSEILIVYITNRRKYVRNLEGCILIFFLND